MVASKDSTSPIKDYLQTTLTEIKSGLPSDFAINGTIVLEISTVVQKDKKGGVNISILNLGANVSSNQIQKMTIPIKMLSDKEKEIAKIAQSNKEMAESTMKKISTSRYLP